MQPETITAQDVQNRLNILLTDLELSPSEQGVTREEALTLLADLEATIGARLTEAMRRARNEGHTFEAIGQAVGTSRQAVWNRTSH